MGKNLKMSTWCIDHGTKGPLGTQPLTFRKQMEENNHTQNLSPNGWHSSHIPC